jgi:hypothetical protein
MGLQGITSRCAFQNLKWDLIFVPSQISDCRALAFFCGAKAGKRVGERERMRAAKWSKCFFGWAELNLDSQTRTRGNNSREELCKCEARRCNRGDAGKRGGWKRREMKEGRAQNSGRRGGRRKKRKWWSLSLEERTEGRAFSIIQDLSLLRLAVFMPCLRN